MSAAEVSEEGSNKAQLHQQRGPTSATRPAAGSLSTAGKACEDKPGAVWGQGRRRNQIQGTEQKPHPLAAPGGLELLV